MCHRNICHFFILNSLNKRLVWLDVSQKHNISPWFSHKDNGLDQISGGQTDEHRTAESTDDGTDGKWILSRITHARAPHVVRRSNFSNHANRIPRPSIVEFARRLSSLQGGVKMCARLRECVGKCSDSSFSQGTNCLCNIAAFSLHNPVEEMSRSVWHAPVRTWPRWKSQNLDLLISSKINLWSFCSYTIRSNITYLKWEIFLSCNNAKMTQDRK